MGRAANVTWLTPTVPHSITNMLERVIGLPNEKKMIIV